MKIGFRQLYIIILTVGLPTACHRHRATTAAESLKTAEVVHAASPDSVKAYEDLLRTAILKAEAELDWTTCAQAALLLSAQLQWTDEPEALSLAKKAQQALAKKQSAQEGTSSANEEDNSASLGMRINLVMAGLYEQTGDTARARSLYEECLRSEDSRNVALSRLANLSLASGDAAGALALARQIHPNERDTSDVEPLFVLANCYLQCDSLAAARQIYQQLIALPNSKARYVAYRHLSEIAILDRRLDELPAGLDSAFASAEDVFFEALQQKDAYFHATLEQERRAERLAYHGRLLNWALLGITTIGTLTILFIISVSRQRRATQRQRLLAEQRERELVEQRLQHEAQEREREAHEAEERLFQQGQKIQLLQRFILDKSEVLQRLREEGDHKRQLSRREWTDVEQMLDSITDGFVARLRAAHPEFREEDIQLCMLTRMKLSNQVISSIYLITVSAVKHRKLKLKKDGFGETNPERPLDDVLDAI